MSRVIHFEIAADDPARIEKFYNRVFEWEFTKWDGPVEYWLVKTGDGKQAGINGGLMKKMPGQTYGTINYVAVSSIDESLTKIQSNGGKIIMPKEQIPQVGYIAICADIEKNIFGVIQPDEKAMSGGK